jgi:hypothetical protein
VILTALLLVTRLAAVEPEPASNPTLRAELITMRDGDQEARRRWLKDQKNEALKKEVAAVDTRNVARLREILKTYGWPGKALVGTDGAGAAWTIAQHGGQLFLEQTVPLMRAAAGHGDLDWSLVATSIDRVLLGEGKQQLYGTQFDTEGDKCTPINVADPAHVDDRRRSVGLGPISEYAQIVCTTYKTAAKP